MDSWDSFSHYSNSSSNGLEERLYQHLQHCRQQHPPHQVLERFHQLFIEAEGYRDAAIWATLGEIVRRPQAPREFKYTLNRCCYTLINPWYTQPREHWAIPELISQFQTLPQAPGSTAMARRIRQLVQDFTGSEQYASLYRLQQMFTETGTTADTDPDDKKPLSCFIRNYPYLYDHSLLTKDSDEAQKQNIQDMRRRPETQLGVKLARYHTQSRQHSPQESRQNPTLLSDEHLSQALTYYTGKVDGCRSHRDLASWFTAFSRSVRSFGDFKEEFCDYLMGPVVAVEPKYSGNHFTRRLRQCLRETLSEFDDQRLTPFLVVELCRRLLNFLVVDNPRRPVFRNFTHLINDIGYALTMGLLLRLVLFCKSAKPWLERCFAVLFNYHERLPRQQVSWLVQGLEHVNVALLTNFGEFGYQF